MRTFLLMLGAALCLGAANEASAVDIKIGEINSYSTLPAFTEPYKKGWEMAVDEIKEQRMTFNGTKEEWQPFFNHALNIYRVKEIQGVDENDPQYGWRWVWKRKGPDHFFLSFIYALIGFDKFSEDLAQIVSKNNMFSGIPQGQFADKGRVIRGESLGDNF